ncbi:MAG: thioredoxin domain-containing protein [Planctomycetota bacterium]|nr:thioredoxin domain-containing protein [Planctomycetota bacterium]
MISLLALTLALPLQHSPVRQPLPAQEDIDLLPPDGGHEFNRLVFEQSPYLRQHARNPVDWYPWGEEAFERARAENKPVFLSIGYSTCHWCHVMEHESFEDEQVAALMNEHFVCVKVDREERPDVDQAYMTVTQAMTGSGGWPMTVVMTPDRRPFFAGTYFPKHGRGGRAGMMQLTPQLAEAWRSQGDRVEEHASRIVEHVKGLTGGSPGARPGREVLLKAYAELQERYDDELGGFGMAPKFPVPHNLRFLLRQHDRTGDPAPLEMAVATLRAMHAGGVWDHVGKGLHRYSTDREWLVPHFEKMLYDQATFSMACVEAWQVTGHEDLRRAAEETFEYVLRDLLDPGGAFHSAEDADSEGEEGLFYVWTMDELVEVLGAQDAHLLALAYGAEDEGNFREEATGAETGRNILHRPLDQRERLLRENLDADEVLERMPALLERLMAVRVKRIRPFLDDKVLTDWNGLMIAALATGAKAFDAPRYAEAAARAADFVLANLVREDGRLIKRWRAGDAAHDAMLEDHAFMAWGLVELYEATGEVRWLREARRIVDLALEQFWDEEGGGFFLSPADGEALFVRAKDVYDGAIPSGNSVMALVLARLARMTGEVRYEERAWGVLEAFSGQLQRMASGHTQLLLALDFLMGPSSEVVVFSAGPATDPAACASIFRPFLPRKVVLHRHARAESLSEVAPFVADLGAAGEKTTYFVCRDFACSAPTTDLAEVLHALAARAEPEGSSLGTDGR